MCPAPSFSPHRRAPSGAAATISRWRCGMEVDCLRQRQPRRWRSLAGGRCDGYYVEAPGRRLRTRSRGRWCARRGATVRVWSGCRAWSRRGSRSRLMGWSLFLSVCVWRRWKVTFACGRTIWPAQRRRGCWQQTMKRSGGSAACTWTCSSGRHLYSAIVSARSGGRFGRFFRRCAEIDRQTIQVPALIADGLTQEQPRYGWPDRASST